jgi:hypothetical protein
LEIGESIGSITCRTNPQESKAMMNILKMLWPFKRVADYQRRYETQRELLIQRIHVCNDLERQIIQLLALQKEHEKQIAELQQALDKEHSRSECFRDQIISLRKEITEFTEVTRIIGNRIAQKL